MSRWKSYSTSGTKIVVAPDRDTRLKSQITAATAHYLNNTAAVVGLRRITKTVNHLHSRIHGRIKTNGIFTAGNIIINRTGNTNAGNSRARQITGTAERNRRRQ